MIDGERKAPTGTVTFVFSDIEGSTVRWDSNREAMQAAVRRHDELMRDCIKANAGYVFKTIGDAFCVAFGSAESALAATLQAQRSIAAQGWSAVGGLRVRMAIHTGIADERDDDYYGPTVNRVARLLAIGHGGQVLVSGAARSLIEERVIPEIHLVDLGMHRLKDLSTPEHVFQLGAEGLAADFPPLHSLDAVPNNLPAQLTPLVGRDSEVAEIRALVELSRLVTLVGSGGIGKTRTALQVAAELARADGAWFVDLASCEDPSLVVSAISAVFNVPDEAGGQHLTDRLAMALQTKKLLIVLDNCEQVVEAAASAVNKLLQSCSELRFLATSREGLGIAGEEIYRLPLLPVPPEEETLSPDRLMEYGAAALFVARARATQKSFEVTDENAGLIGEIVRRLDGIALAIELAAARVKVLSVSQLSQRLNDRLKLLTGGSRTALPRQQTLRALIGWSYDLLSEIEKSVFRQAAVLRGTWTLEALEAIWLDESVSGDVLDAVTALADKSLLVVETGDEQNRYRLLESTRDFALERLIERGEFETAARRHCEYFAVEAARLDDRFWGINSDVWVTLVRSDIENYRSAIDWGLSAGGAEASAATIVASLRWFYWAVATGEGRSAIERIDNQSIETFPKRVRALLTLSAHMLGGTLAQGVDSVREAERLLADQNDLKTHAESLMVLADAMGKTGDLHGSALSAESAVAQARSVGIPIQLGSFLSSAAYALALAGDDERARAFLDEAEPIVRRSDDRPTLARLQAIRAELLFAAGDTAAALACSREAEATYRERSNPAWLNVVLLNEASYYLAENDSAGARNVAREALTLARRRDDAFKAAVAIGHLARIAAEGGCAERAARLTGFVDATYARLGSVREPTEQRGYERTRQLIAEAVSEDRVAALLDQGASMSQKDAEEEALAVPSPA
ncbi:MAG TPA: adenylate/guanylate cyclase domain-containing protein [Candidatus Baltobacteraceae bacterium]|nr:adenylate/guanylate cyclase domain-containing protein [Candidatus Baltobacteraceae bacterium]